MEIGKVYDVSTKKNDADVKLGCCTICAAATCMLQLFFQCNRNINLCMTIRNFIQTDVLTADVFQLFYKKLKNVSCEYDRVNG